MKNEQKKIAKKMLKEGGRTFGEIYQAVYKTNPMDDCTCVNPEENGCSCEVSKRLLELVMMRYEKCT